MSKVTNENLTRSGRGGFIAVPIWQRWASKGWVFLTLSIRIVESLLLSGVSTWWLVRIGLFTSSARLAQCRSYTQSVCTVQLGFLFLSHRHAASLPLPRPYIQLSRFACLLLLTVLHHQLPVPYKPMLKGINLTLSDAGNMRSRNLYQKKLYHTCKFLVQVLERVCRHAQAGRISAILRGLLTGHRDLCGDA